MADIDIRRTHHLGPAAARKAAERMAEDLGRKFGLAGGWDGDVLRFERPGVSGSLTMGPNDLHLVVTLGFLLKAMKGSIEEAVRRELDSILSVSPSHGEHTRAAEKSKSSSKGKKASTRPKKGG